MSLLVVAIATGAFASEPFIAIADVETGRALVPEGTVVPSGVLFFATKHNGNEDQGADADSSQRIPLVFAYAPASKFAEARTAIDATRAMIPAPTMQYAMASNGTGERRAENGRLGIGTNAAEWIYLYFDDGSYIVALRDIQTNNGVTWYGSGMSVYSAPGTYYTGTMDASITSNLNPDIYAQYCGSNHCTMGSSGGYCGTPSYYPTSQQAPNPTVYASGSIFQRWWGCWTNPNSPCMRYYSGTIEVTFP